VNTTNSVRVRVTDNGVPSLSTTQTFTITVLSRPVLLTPQLTTTNAILRWTSIAGQAYSAQFRTNLSITNWVVVPGNVTATGTFTFGTDPTVPNSNRFYRIIVLP